MDEQDAERAGFEFFSNFDSANLAKVEYVPPNESGQTPPSNSGRNAVVPELPDVEFNVWTKPDCFGTEFENANRTWFYFGVRASTSSLLVKLNLVDINRQSKMYSQGMAPVYRVIPGKSHWERVRDKPTYTVEDDIFILTFKYKTPENVQSITYFAFTYPYSFTELVTMLGSVDTRFATAPLLSKDDIYYYREVASFTLEGRRVDLITISSYHNISKERETRLKNLFPEQNFPRPFRFIGKKVIFVSARVHPGETPSSFVFNGFLNLLLNREDPVAIALRRQYVFKLIPMLNPDGVAKGHYRTDTRGVNLNRVYLAPSLTLHPSIYAARALIRYYHFGYEKEEVNFESADELNDNDDESSVEDSRHDNKLTKKVSHMTLDENKKNSKRNEVWCNKCKTNIVKLEDTMPGISNIMPTFNHTNPLSTGKGCCRNCGTTVDESESGEVIGDGNKCEHGDTNINDSGIFLYMDMHGHASKKGIFMYGNHFEEFEKNIECMLLPKIMSLNNHNFHFTACNFTERNMYLKDRRDGMSREGSGRVAVLKLTGLVRSYTLECNYNTGRLVNSLPSTIKDTNSKLMHSVHVPPKYTPHVFEEVGRGLGASILDLTGHNPITRLPNSQFHTLNGLREWLRTHCANELGETRCTPARIKLRNSTSLHASQGKTVRAIKTRSASAKGPKRITTITMRSASVPIERKENIDSQPSCSNILSGPRARPKSFNRKFKKESTLKVKSNTTNEKPKPTITLRPLPPAHKQKLELIPSKLQTIKEKSKNNESEESTSSNRLKLREICFIKSPTEGTKTMIAKYKAKDKDNDSKGSEDNLVVAWDANNTAQVFTQKINRKEAQEVRPLVPEPVLLSNNEKNTFRVHNFSKGPVVKVKRTKRPLRRLTTATDSPAKVEKLKKRKILKSQTT